MFREFRDEQQLARNSVMTALEISVRTSYLDFRSGSRVSLARCVFRFVCPHPAGGLERVGPFASVT
jgi:hypothetical protein